MLRLSQRYPRHSWSVKVAATLLVAFIFAAGPTSFATDLSVAEDPRAPCSGAPYPNYPPLGAMPEVVMWSADELGEHWSLPACTEWLTGSATNVVGLAGHFHDQRDTDAILAQIGAISSLRRVRYWSVTDKAWNTLFARATALDGPDPSKPRADFSLAEIRAGRDFYFLAADNRSRGDTVWRLRVREIGRGRIIVETANVTPLRWFFVPLVSAGNIQTSYFLERAGNDSWYLYSLTRMLYASPLLTYFAPRSSYINRAVALYRHYAGIPTDSDPPAAP